MSQTVGVFSGDSSLIADLRAVCPGWTFTDAPRESEDARVTVVDRDQPEVLEHPPRRNIVRIILRSEPLAVSRRAGEIRVLRADFLRSPNDFLEVASEMADAVVHASQLEQEVGYLTQIQELMSMVDEAAVSERVTRSILNILNLPRAVLLLHDSRLERYVPSFTNDPDFHETGEFLTGVPHALLQRALASGDFRAYDQKERLIIVPLQADQDLIGVIRIPVPSGQGVDDAALAQVTRFLKPLTRVLGNVYFQTRSHDLAMRDDLTKAFNRRFFESYLDEEIERSRRYGSLFSIIFLDLDDLKTINNAHGHLAGSRTLQEVAKRVLGAVRGIDKVVRFGGDEFCVLLPQTDSEPAVMVANRIRKALTADKLRIDAGIDVTITASFGIATYPTHALTKEDLIRQADQAMYRVKSTTKNAVGVASLEGVVRG